MPLIVRIAKRLLIWVMEVAGEALLLSFVLLGFSGLDREFGIAREILAFVAAIGLMFFSTGYLLTTAIARVYMAPRLLFSGVAVGLFEIHFLILSYAVGGALQKTQRIAVQFSGGIVVFLWTLFGTWLLRRWDKLPKRSEAELRSPSP